MTVRHLPRLFDPRGEILRRAIIGKLDHTAFVFHFRKRTASIRDEKIRFGQIAQDTNQTDLGNAARGKLPSGHPPVGRRMENVTLVGERDQHVDI